jgi:hypothetical protein
MATNTFEPCVDIPNQSNQEDDLIADLPRLAFSVEDFLQLAKERRQ